jgi:hypothetical protein
MKITPLQAKGIREHLLTLQTQITKLEHQVNKGDIVCDEFSIPVFVKECNNAIARIHSEILTKKEEPEFSRFFRWKANNFRGIIHFRFDANNICYELCVGQDDDIYNKRYRNSHNTLFSMNERAWTEISANEMLVLLDNPEG